MGVRDIAKFQPDSPLTDAQVRRDHLRPPVQLPRHTAPSLSTPQLHRPLWR